MLINVKEVYIRLIEKKLVDKDLMLAMIDIQLGAGKITQEDAQELIALMNIEEGAWFNEVYSSRVLIFKEE